MGRDFLLRSVNVGLLASLLPFGKTPRPSGLGVQDYGNGGSNSILFIHILDTQVFSIV